MQSQPPTTLVIPLTSEHASAPTSSFSFSPVFIVLSIVLFIGAYAAFGFHRRRQIDAHELTFRKLAKQMGFTRKQMASIRRYATKMNVASPVGVMMNQEHVAQALAE